MELYELLLLSIIQGITEWLPISSSGHLVIAQQLLHIDVPIYYNILLHVATLIVIFLVYYKEIWKIIKAIIKLDFKDEYGKMGLLIIVASIPTAIIGFTFKEVFLSFFTNLKIIGIALIVTGIILLLTKLAKGKRRISFFDSFFIGSIQALAIIPGISRSGSTISIGLLWGINKEKITTFSFLLSVPAIIGASILEFETTLINWEIIFAMIVTIIVGYISLKFTIKSILKNKFHLFFPYCITLGIILLIFS